MEIEERNSADGIYEDAYEDAGADEEELRRMRRRERIERVRREKERRILMQKLFVTVLPAAVLLIAGSLIFVVLHGKNSAGRKKAADSLQEGTVGTAIMPEKMNGTQEGQLAFETEPSVPGSSNAMQGGIPEGKLEMTSDDGAGGAGSGEQTGDDGHAQAVPKPAAVQKHYAAQLTAQTAAPPEEVDSSNVILINLESGNILAQRDCKAVVSPASMTKVLTALVAAEHVTNLNDTFTMTIDITDYSYSHGCSSVGFDVGEVVTVRDLFYGTVLPSGGDAAVALAVYTAGSHEAFVDMMNGKLEELGLADSAHFTNCVGLYDENHHCSVYDMAMIMEAAMDNELCREVLSAHTYTTSVTEQHPEGIPVSNWFLRRIEDKDTGGEVICGKTGYVVQSGNCAVSYAVDAAGHGYICATVDAHSGWRCIYDHVALYKAYAREE